MCQIGLDPALHLYRHTIEGETISIKAADKALNRGETGVINVGIVVHEPNTNVDTNYAKKNRDRSESKASSVGSGVIEGIKSDIGLGEPSRFDEYPREGAYAPRELQRLFGEMEVISTAEFYETVAMLGETEIDDRQQKTGRTLMMMAVKKNQLQKFSMLLTCGASARCVSNDGSTALSLATSSMDTVQYIEPLLARGADVNAGAGLPAGTALHAAVRSRSLTLVCRVLE